MELVVVGLAVGAALVYAGRGAWRLLRPQAKNACGCSSAGDACAGCPVAVLKNRDRTD